MPKCWLLVTGLVVVYGAVFTDSTVLSAAQPRGESTRSQPCGGGISLSMVLDTTSSMRKPLNVIRKHMLRIVNSLGKTPGHQVHNYVVVPLNEPMPANHLKTTSPRRFTQYLNRATPFGGGDCKEFVLTALLKAIEESCPQSTIFVFSDSTPKDQNKLGMVLDRLQEKRQHVVFVLSGRCGHLNSPSQNAIKTIATTSGGQTFWTLTGNLGVVLNYMRMTYKPQPIVLLAWQLHAANKTTETNITIAVDESVASVSAFVSCTGRSPNVTFTPPTGSDARIGSRHWKKNVDNIFLTHVGKPVVGEWALSMRSRSECMVRVVGTSFVDFTTKFQTVERARENGAADPQRDNIVQAEIEGASQSRSTRPSRGEGVEMFVGRSGNAVNLDRVEVVSIGGGELSSFLLGEALPNTAAEVDVRVGQLITPAENFYLVYRGHYQGATLIRFSTSAIWPRPTSTAMVVDPNHPVARANVCGALRAECSITGHMGEVVPAVWMRGQSILSPSTRISLMGEATRVLEINPVHRVDTGTYTCTPAAASGQVSSGLLQVVVDGTDSSNDACMPIAHHNWHHRECIFITCTLPMDELTNNVAWQRNTQQLYHDSRNVFIFSNGTLVTCRSVTERNSMIPSGEYTCRGRMRSGEEVVRTALVPSTGNALPNTTFSGACAPGRHNCHYNAKCLPTLRSYVCVCNEGYTGNGRQCAVMSCPMPSNPANGQVMITGGISAGARIRFMCTAGYEMVGDRQQQCQSDGRWSGIKPQCVWRPRPTAARNTPAPPSVLQIVPASVLQEIDETGCVTLRCTVRGTANPRTHWHYNGQALRMNDNIRALSDGSLRICPFIAAAHNGNYACLAMNDEKQMSVRRFTVRQTVRSATARPAPRANPAITTGVLQEPTTAPRQCPDLVSPSNGGVRTMNSNNAGSVAYYNCQRGYRLMGGDASRQCDMVTLRWTGTPPRCEREPEPTRVIYNISKSWPVQSCVQLTCNVQNPAFHRSLKWTHSNVFQVLQNLNLGQEATIHTGENYIVSLEERSLTVCNGLRQQTGQYCCVVRLAGQRYSRCVTLQQSDMTDPNGSTGSRTECSSQLSQCTARRSTCERALEVERSAHPGK